MTVVTYKAFTIDSRMRIHFLTTGGTIDKLYFDAKSEYQIGSPQVMSLLQELELAFPYTIEPLMAKDSLDLTEDDRSLIRERVLAAPADRVIVTHGTDTMVETAKKLQGIPGKTIVLTGAMQPARFHRSDAVFNVGASIGAVSCLPQGVYLCMNGRIFDPHRVRKNRELGRFEEITS